MGAMLVDANGVQCALCAFERQSVALVRNDETRNGCHELLKSFAGSRKCCIFTNQENALQQRTLAHDACQRDEHGSVMTGADFDTTTVANVSNAGLSRKM